MRKFTKKIFEENKLIPYSVNCNLTMKVKAENEGEAGYLSDRIIQSIEEVEDYRIVNIEEYISESKDIPKYLENWSIIDGYLQKNFELKDMNEAVKFVNNINTIANELKHHPQEIIINFNKVNIKVKTNATNDTTNKDYRFAERVDKMKKNKI